jgi:hypothetical protein
MRKYSINNSLLNYDIFKILFIVTIPFVFFLTKVSLTIIIISVFVFIALFILAIRLFKKWTFELKFNDNEIIVDYFNLNRQDTYSYNDLISIKYIQTGKGISINKFVFSKGQTTKTYRTPLIESGEEFVTFIKYLKTKNNTFKTFVEPKGSTIHMRLRQELLGTEY